MRLSPLILALVLMAGPAAAQSSDDTAAVDSLPNYVIRIDRATVGDMALDDTLDVVLESYGAAFAGFVLKVATASPYVDIIEILKGEIPDSCGWELFNPRKVHGLVQDGDPLTVWQVTGLAKTTPDNRRPTCIGFDRPASLLRMVVTSAHALQIPDTSAPIFFYWEDCRDNVVSDSLGDKLVVSANVIDYFPVAQDFQRDGFPTRFGTPSQCIKP
ncbi:MAG: hypothetical protein KKA42_07055, partial [candidate division Zixibacteria bacterium]|nr:hypothetical protein [candidate division Zixibacteria bacterium]